MISQNLLNQLRTDEIKKGYSFDERMNCFACIFCNAKYEKGMIYQSGSGWMDAERSVSQHILDSHQSVFDALLNLDKKQNGLSEVQKEILKYMFNGLSDNEIAKKMDNKSASTVRNHRFILREKYKEAKILIPLMELFEEKIDQQERFVSFHSHLPFQDERIITTEKEKEAILNKYFKEMKLLKFPKKEKEKLIVLQKIAAFIDKEKKYSEKEINRLLKSFFEDYVLIRRYLVDYGFLDRLSDGSEYWFREK